MTESGWEFWVDRGGTFTDCIARAPDGELHSAKVLSSDEAPVEAIRSILESRGIIEPGSALPPCSVKLGSTVATNALLERRGAPTLLVANRGLGDVLRIGTQQRPHLFDLAVSLPAPLQSAVAEVSGRVGVGGEPIEDFDEASAREQLQAARERGLTSAAIVLIHAYAYPELEARLRELATDLGFDYVVASHEIARELGLLARGETTVADAYLTPLLRRHVDKLAASLPGSRLRFMQSSGGLTEAARFRGPNALLSGPAGGVVAAARVAKQAGFEGAIAFDMGGTSTDVSLISGGEVDRAFETLVGGIRVKAPMLRIHTVAAGGGSLCGYDGFSFFVGPESAGALPGPLCYGRRDAAGRRLASRLALTDVNFALGRVQPDRFPFELERAPVDDALAELGEALARDGVERSRDALAAGFVAVANANMAQAIAEVSVARGVDPRGHALVGFGGAAGQHVCGIARSLGISRILLHPLAGLLSAYGIGIAEVSWDGQRDAGRRLLAGDAEPLAEAIEAGLRELEEAGRAALRDEGIAAERVRVERILDLRYVGTDTPLAIAREPAGQGASASWREAFTQEHERRFGYARDDRDIEIVTARVRAHAPSAGSEHKHGGVGGALASSGSAPAPVRREAVWFPGLGRVDAPVFERESIAAGCEIRGPALILEDTGSVVLDPGFCARSDARGVLCLTDEQPDERHVAREAGEHDPVRLEIFGNRFMSIAEQMGAVLRNTAFSTNIKERLDYSCAVFDASGGLVANAPHIPVHLGAMGETVRAVQARFPDLAPGDVVVTNDPFEGGSHLPDVTVVTPVFLDPAAAGAASFFVASRGHHADLGGITPGSMPPDSRSIEEEGVLLKAFRLVRGGRFDEERIREALAGARYPARRPADNIADLEAMVAANRAGVHLLEAFVELEGLAVVQATMRQLQEAAAFKVAREIAKLPDGRHTFQDALDDGTPICVRLEVEGDRMRIDFEGTGPAVAGNLNAPRAVVHAAVIYVLRSLVQERIPLNGGCLDPVEIRIPEGSILDPPEGSAVVGGNVETSQRVVDVLLGALGVVSASQGTMNNVTFGDASFGYYETIGGGSGAGPSFDGASGVHTHMTNTRITDAEVLESRYPVRLQRFSLRADSGGAGRHRGGDGLVRHYTFTAPVTATLLSERRERAPYALQGGEPGACGRNQVVRRDSASEPLPGKCTVQLEAGDSLVVETPGGGGFGPPEPAAGF